MTSYLPNPEVEASRNVAAGDSAVDLQSATPQPTPDYGPDVIHTQKESMGPSQEDDELSLPLANFSQAMFDVSNQPLNPSEPFNLQQSHTTRPDLVAVGDLDIFNYESNWLPFDTGTHFDFDIDDTCLIDGAVDEPSFFNQDMAGCQIDSAPQGFSLLVAANQEHIYPKDTAMISPHHTSPSSEFGSGASGSNSLNQKVRKPRGSYYVDGEGARKSQMEESRSAPRLSRRGPQSPSEHSSTNPSRRVRQNSTRCYSSSPLNQGMEYPLIGPDVFEMLLSKQDHKATATLSDQRPPMPEFHGVSIDLLNSFAQLYFEKFDTLYPFMDRSLLNATEWGWSLSLATAAIGARYSELEDAMEISDILLGVLHQLLTKDYDLGNEAENLAYVQARALNVVGLCQSDKTHLIDLGYKTSDKVFAAGFRLGLFDEFPKRPGNSEPQLPDREWNKWRVGESRRRTGFFIWVLDCVLAYTSNMPPRLPANCVNLLLPSSAQLWEASTSSSWQVLYMKETGPQGFRQAIFDLYSERRLPDKFSDFTALVLVHGLIRRMLDVANHFADPLWLWTPSASPQPQSPSTYAGAPIPYLATLTQFQMWRNSTCDSLDVIHWDALSTSLKLGGLEGPIFLNLHLSRLVLLSPVKELEALISEHGKARPAILPHNRLPLQPSRALCEKIVWTWVKRDRFKARLAVIHAAATFWHVRRFSSDSFVQPFAMFLAVAVLWAYGLYTFKDQKATATDGEGEDRQFERTTECPLSSATAETVLEHGRGSAAGFAEQAMTDSGGLQPIVDRRRSSSASSSGGKISGPSNSPAPAFMNLDRPCDDELVQKFIRSGHSIKVFMENVGELCSADGPKLLLREGVRLLRKKCTSVWSVARLYADQLEAATTNSH